MKDTFSASPRLLWATGILAKWALRLVAGGWLVLILLWVALHFAIVPRIDTLRPWLEEQASRTLGVVVRIESISAQSNGLIPSVELRGVRVQDAQGRTALELDRVVAAVSPRSLLSGGVEQLLIDGPVLDVRRSADGTVWVGGFILPPSVSSDSAGADWLFSQPELAIRHGTLHWTDALRDAPALELSDVDLVLRNRHFTHSLRVDASSSAHWGERLSLQGVFTQPLLSLHAGHWQDWQGQWYTDFKRLDWAQLRPYLDVGTQVQQGRGSLRAWIDIKRAAVTGATIDVLLDEVHLGPLSQQQVLRSVSGRLAYRALGEGREYSTQGLQFETDNGIRWPGGNARISLWDASAGGKTGVAKPAHGEFSGDRLDLATLSQLAKRLSVDESLSAALQAYQPGGMVQTLRGSWTGALQAPTAYALQGRITQASLAAQPNGLPGFEGMDLDLELTQNSGKAHLSMSNGSLDLRGFLAEPVLPLAHLSADLQWRQDGARLSAALSNLRFANADAQGEAQMLRWSNADASGRVQPGPGMLELQASLSRAELARVHRYLPLVMEPEVRDYLRDAVRGGTASGVKLMLKGDLSKLPFAGPKQGDFRLSATLTNGIYAYVPPSLNPKGRKPWPAFTQLSGELLIDRATLSLKGVRALWGAGAGQPGVPVDRADAQINSLYGGATAAVNLQGKAPLADALAVVNASALDDLLSQALNHAVASGMADYRLKLDLPLIDPRRIMVGGSVNLLGNDVQVLPGTPRVTRARGQITFSESGLGINGVVGQALGGEVRVDGSLSGFGDASKSVPDVLRLQGSASAEGLRQAAELGVVANSLARYATGATNYQATVAMRAGVPEMVVSSSLGGLGLSLPVPFAKTPALTVPVRLELGGVRSGTGALLPGQNQIRLDWGRLASLALLTTTRPGDQADGLEGDGQMHLQRGVVVVGTGALEPLVLPERGLSVSVGLEALDVDAWSAWLDSLGAPGAGGKKADVTSLAPGADSLPMAWSLRVRELSWGGHTMHKVAASGNRAGKLWRAQVNATEFSGQLEYRQPSVPDLVTDSANTGRLFARLSHLTLGSSEAQDVENLLDEQPAGIPALDVVVEDFELRGKKLGRLEVEAVNQTSLVQREPQREWRLKRLSLSMPAATLNATGAWRLQQGTQAPSIGVPGAYGKNSTKDQRHTMLDFKLDIQDSGGLLERFGMKDVIRQGKGKIEGQIDWQGSPISLDYPTLGGNFNVNLEKGEFLKADPGIAKLLGVLSLQSLPRRLMLDFRDVFAEGFPFDFVRGDVAIAKGIARTNNLQMKGVSAAVLMDGSTDVAKETQSIKVVVVPELNAGGASLITATINPLVGLYSFLAQLVLRQPLIAAGTQELFIDGTWLEPRVTKVDRRAPTK